MTKGEAKRPLRYRGVALRSPADWFAPDAKPSVEHPAFAALPRRRLRKLWSSLNQPTAPAPIGWPLLGAWALMLFPAALGAVLAWDVLVTSALLVPGFVRAVSLERAEARAREITERVSPSAPAAVLGAFVVWATTGAGSPRYFALTYVVLCIVILEPLDRFGRRRHSRKITAKSDRPA
jgi:hypothetical protein